MGSNEAQSQEDALKKLYAFVINQMKTGAGKTVIAQKLVEMGINEGDAYSMVETIHAQVLKAAEEERFEMDSLAPAILGGGLAAAVGGGIWGLVVIGTGYVIGFMAWGIGLLAGYAVLLFSRGRKGTPLQAIAVLSSVLGIAIGKYVTFFHFLKQAITNKYGPETASGVSLFSERVIHFYIEGIGSMVSGFDILWVVFAVITAWRIPKGLGIKV
jgi:hypothetical protein